MKKLLVIFIAGSFLIACGSGKKSNETKGNDSTKTDTTKTDTSTVNVPKTKDYAYYLGQFKGLTLEGVELEQFSLYEDTAAKNINIIYTVNNADVVGYNKVILALSNCSRLIGEDKTKCMDFTMDNFLSRENNGRPKAELADKANEYKSGETTFYYCTHKNIRGSMGEKNYHMTIIEGRSGEMILTGKISVSDLKSDMVKAEEAIKKVADYLAQ